MKKERDSGIELLRIVAIFMVIGVHLLDYGKYYATAMNVDGIVQSSALIFRIFVRSAVNIFLIISGFFMVRAEFNLKKSYKRILRVYLSIFFYSVVLSIIALCIGNEGRLALGIDKTDLFITLKMLFPISSQTWYFLTDYILVMLLVPFVNLALNSISKKQYQVLLGILGFIMSIWLFAGSIDVLRPFANGYGYDGISAGKNVFSFIFMYIIGGYISLHVKSDNKPKLRYLFIAMTALAANYFIYTRFNEALGNKYEPLIYANPFIIMVAIFIFMFFKDLHFKSKIINTLGGTTLGVYAISEFWLVRAWLWNIIDFSKVDCTNIFKNIAMIFVGILAVFFSCAVIELFRAKLFDKIEFAVKKLIKAE